MAQSQGYRGRGIVLNTIKYGDNSMVVHLLTDVAGQRSFMVNGVRSGRGRGSKMALFQPLFALEFEGLSPHRGEMHRFREVQSGIVLRRTPFDIRRSTIALFMAEVLYRLIRESESNGALFEFVWSSIEALDMVEEGVSNFHLWFLANLSRHLGFVPSDDYTEGVWFDIVEGHFTHSRPTHKLTFDPAEAQLFSRLLHLDVTTLGDIELSRVRRVELLEALLRYYGYHLDSIERVQSIKILKELF